MIIQLPSDNEPVVVDLTDDGFVYEMPTDKEQDDETEHS